MLNWEIPYPAHVVEEQQPSSPLGENHLPVLAKAVLHVPQVPSLIKAFQTFVNGCKIK